jgi:hypothetical protein
VRGRDSLQICFVIHSPLKALAGDRMQPPERRETGEQDLFRSRLDQIIDMKHPLVTLGARWIGSSWNGSLGRFTPMIRAARHCRRD